MPKYLMTGLAVSNAALNIGAIICVFIFPPEPFAALSIAIATTALISLTEGFKRKLLLDKMQKVSVVTFASLVLVSLLYLVLGLVMLIYLNEVQKGELKVNPNLDQLMWQRSESITQQLTFGEVSVVTLVFYLLNWVTVSLYAREYYRMFWVNNIVHIFRYLKLKVQHMNETLLSHLPVIQFTKQLKKEKCCLCIEYYQEMETLTKLNCGHIFHRDCIRLWVFRSNACPLCRKRVAFY